MNIIKFIDKMASGSHPDADFFNNHLRGKYAYWLHCEYVVAMEDITILQAVSFEEDIDELFNSSIQYIDLPSDSDHWIRTEKYVDDKETERVNNVDAYIRANEFVPEDIDIEHLKNFRTWLAELLLSVKINTLDDDQKHVLEYYANGMTDETIKWLTEFGNQTTTFENTFKEVACGCTGSSNVSSLYNNVLSICNPISIYKVNLHNAMVEMFSNIDFWDTMDNNDLEQIIVYLKGIIKNGLSLVSEDSPSMYETFTCKCLSNPNAAQEVAQAIIEDLIASFDLIIKDDIVKNKLFILQTLSKWSDNLYEIMQWN